MPWQIVLRDTANRGAHHLRLPRTVVGSAPEADLQVPDLSVSRRHAALILEGESLAIEDLGSRNGTRIGGERIVGTAPLVDGAELGFGTVVATVQRVDPREVQPAVRFESVSPTKAPVGSAATTLGGDSLHALLTAGLPGLLRDLADGVELRTMAGTVGRVVLDLLPARRARVLRFGEGGAGILFVGDGATGTGEDVVDPACTVRAESGDLILEVSFRLTSQARGYRPLVEGLADLLRASRSGLRMPVPTRETDQVPLPSPPSVEPVVQEIYAQAQRVARGEVSVLIRGESGTGKEVLARYIHAASARHGEAFVALNCAALPRDLLESELFGVEAGVATGVRARPGIFELADRGTLFLDEIGDMALETQARILRVLQEGEVYRLGGSEARPARVRVLSATNRDLEALRRDGAFRDDLYHRIADWVVELPPLRRRRRDVPNLAAAFLLRECDRRGVRAAGISAAAMEAIVAYPWPGNVRQLEREMARAALFLESGELLQVRHLQPALREAGEPGDAVAEGTLQAAVEAAERAAIRRALEQEAGNMAAAARVLGIGRTTLYRRIKELGIEG